jgi:hypothetical protein
MAKAEEYFARAADCQKKADEAMEVEAKRLLEQAAHEWRNMAAQAQRHGW